MQNLQDITAKKDENVKIVIAMSSGRLISIDCWSQETLYQKGQKQMRQHSPVVKQMSFYHNYYDLVSYLKKNQDFNSQRPNSYPAQMLSVDLQKAIKAKDSQIRMQGSYDGRFEFIDKIIRHQLNLSSLTEESLYQPLLLAQSSLKPAIKHIRVWDSQLGPLFFQTLRGTKWEIESLQFLNCQIGNSLGPLIRQKLRPPIIRSIVLGSDPISNRGVGQLMRLDLACLEVLVLINTDITNDAVKLFNKKRGLYCRLAIQDQCMFQHLPFFKEGLSVCNPVVNYWQECLIGISLNIEPQLFFYRPQEAKINLNLPPIKKERRSKLASTLVGAELSSKRQCSKIEGYTTVMKSSFLTWDFSDTNWPRP